MKRVLILGSTGSIGTQALDVIERSPELFEVVGLSAGRSHEQLIAQAERHGVTRIARQRSRRRGAAPPRRGPAARCCAAPRG